MVLRPPKIENGLNAKGESHKFGRNTAKDLSPLGFHVAFGIEQQQLREKKKDRNWLGEKVNVRCGMRKQREGIDHEKKEAKK